MSSSTSACPCMLVKPSSEGLAIKCSLRSTFLPNSLRTVAIAYSVCTPNGQWLITKSSIVTNFCVFDLRSISSRTGLAPGGSEDVANETRHLDEVPPLVESTKTTPHFCESSAILKLRDCECTATRQLAAATNVTSTPLKNKIAKRLINEDLQKRRFPINAVKVTP